MATTEGFAPAKINLTLHVTGQRADGYHLLDSIVAFADKGDKVRVQPADQMRLCITGPMAGGVPQDRSNLCWRAAEPFDVPVSIELEKHLPAAAGIGGGSSDAAAVIRVMETLTGCAAPFDPIRHLQYDSVERPRLLPGGIRRVHLRNARPFHHAGVRTRRARRGAEMVCLLVVLR